MQSNDDDLIEALVKAQFAALKWDDRHAADWQAFETGFLADAQLVPAARPAKLQPVTAFIARMQGLAANGVLRSFSERALAIHIKRYGNVAIALAGCEMAENNDVITRDVSAFLLVKSADRWHIAAQAWDAETPSNPLPADLLGLPDATKAN